MSQDQDDWLKTHLLESLQGLQHSVGHLAGEFSSLRGEMVSRMNRMEQWQLETEVRVRRTSRRATGFLKDLPWAYLAPVIVAISMGLMGWLAPDQVQGVVLNTKP